METINSFTLALNDIPADGLMRQWHVDDAFFQSLDDAQYQHGSLDVSMTARRTTDGCDIDMKVAGWLTVKCDRCNDDMQVEIAGADVLKVRIGEEAGDDGDFITVPDADTPADLSWNIYETIALAVPMHPVHDEGQCNAEMEELLRQHRPTEQTDERWAALSQLKDTIK